MAVEIKMPKLSDTMESGVLVKWHVKEGDAIEADHVLADVETDKATMEMPSYDPGTVAKIIVPEGQKVNVGQVLAVLAEEGESVEEVAAQYEGGGAAPKAEKDEQLEPVTSERQSKDQMRVERAPTQRRETPAAAPKPSASAPTAMPESPAPSNGQADGRRVLVSPLARRLADEHGLDLTQLEGSGPGGRIIKRDVLEAIESGGAATKAPAAQTAGRGGPAPAMAAPESGALGQTIPLPAMRETIARRLVEAKQTIPHYQVSVTINADPLLALRATINEQLESQGVKLSVNDFIVRACALAIHEHPMFNASWQGNALKIADRVNIGMAISLPDERGGGLLVGTIYDADRKGLRQISIDAKTLADKARSKGLTIEEMSNSTFTISNLGMYEVEHFTAIINPPNAAILAVGRAMKRPVVRNDEITIGHEMTLTTSNDHRIIDGAMAARFMETVKHLLEHPAALLV